MSTTRGTMVIAADTSIKGAVRNCQSVEVFGQIDGEISAESLVVREGGRVVGKVRAGAADVHGLMQGQAYVKNLMRIGRTGAVLGNVQYGALAMEIGAELAADVRNVPPEIFGDLEVTVARGGAVRITLTDLTAVDPDDNAQSLTYSVSHAVGGFVEMTDATGQPARSFTQADLEAARVAFRHDGGDGSSASFDVVVTDHAGATSGTPRTVHVSVR